MKIQFITNVLTPYRIHFFDLLHSELKRQGGELQVLVMMKEDHSPYWNYNDFKRNYTKLLKVKYLKDKSDYFFVNLGVRKAILDYHPDIEIACGAYWILTVISALKICNKNNIKILFWSESNKVGKIDKNALVYSLREKMRKYVYTNMDGFLYPGKLALDLIKDYNHQPDFLFCMPNIVDSRKYKKILKSKKVIQKELGIDEDNIIIFCSAKLSEEKGIMPFLELYLQSDLHNYSCIYIAGKGPEKNRIESFCKKNKLHVKLLNYVEQDTMIKYYHAADFFLLPSLVDPSPLSCVEALWAGLPLILSSSIGNLPEVLNNGVNGFMFDFSEKNQCIKLLDELIDIDKRWYEKASEECYRIAHANFDSEQIIFNFLYGLNEFINK